MKRKLLLLCFSATGLLAAQDACFPSARNGPVPPPPVIHGDLTDGTPPPAAPTAPTPPAPAVLRTVRSSVERVHPSAGMPGTPDTAKVRATLQFVAKPPVPPTPIPLADPIKKRCVVNTSEWYGDGDTPRIYVDELVARTAIHEFGHVMIGPGHPDDPGGISAGGPAP